jgi:protein ImuA
MSLRPAPASGFADLAALMAGQPLHELSPAGPGAEAAALGFALGLAASWAGSAPIVWAGEEGVFAEEGAPYPPGLAQFGLELGRLIVVRAGKREEALWAAEQGLGLPGAVVICALGARGRALDLKTTRRLLLFGERNRARCLLVRPRMEASAAWTRWCVAPAPSVAETRELGAPAYALDLIRSRAGPAGVRFMVEWNAHARAFNECDVACDCVAAPEHGSADPRQARA